MKRFVLFVSVVLCVGSLLAGCGMVDSPSDRIHRIRTIDDVRARQFVDDCDDVMLYDKPSQLSEWPIRDTE